MTSWQARYRRLRLEWPEPGIREIVLDKPETLHSVDAETHTELTRIWRDIDGDPEVRAVVVHGAGRAFSAGGDFVLVEAVMRDAGTRVRVWKEARDLVYNVIDCSKPTVLLLNEPLTGEEAERIGLVSRCVEDGEALTRALDIARRLAQGSPTAECTRGRAPVRSRKPVPLR